jgi:prephenate dehydratase
MIKIAFLGPSGTVSEESARYFLRSVDCEYVPCKQISDVFQAVASGAVDYSVVPIENTIEGSVSLHMDWIVHEVDVPMQAEWVYPSLQNLIGHAAECTGADGEIDFQRIHKVVSHYMAIAQCRQFLREKLPHADYESSNSTADGVRQVSTHPEPGIAAIGTKLAAAKYGLQVLVPDVQDHDNNYTRFVLLGRQPLPGLQTAERHKTSILITLPEDYPGALHQVLSAFSWRRINLSRIESRPTKKKLGSYYFYIDIEASMSEPLVPAAIAEIEAIGCQVRILGSYPGYEYLEVQ